MNADTMRILLIEDNPGDVRLIEECLRSRGIQYELTHCETIDAAVRTVNGYCASGPAAPHLLLLDYNVPRGDARSVLEAAARNPALGNTRKAVVTSSVSPRDQQDALQSGADTFIYKPADLDSFLREVGGKIAELLQTTAGS
jgi:two-component system response regulator